MQFRPYDDNKSWKIARLYKETDVKNKLFSVSQKTKRTQEDIKPNLEEREMGNNGIKMSKEINSNQDSLKKKWTNCRP